MTQVLEPTAVLSDSLGGGENSVIPYDFATEVLESRAVLSGSLGGRDIHSRVHSGFEWALT